jgi:hypothetical protein
MYHCYQETSTRVKYTNRYSSKSQGLTQKLNEKHKSTHWKATDMCNIILTTRCSYIYAHNVSSNKTYLYAEKYNA